MSQFTLLKGNCPVCAGARKDCRQSKRTNLIHCRDSEANPLDYIFQKEDKLGFGMWADKAEVEATSQQQQEERRQQRQLEKQQRLAAEKKQRSQLLSEAERDREIRKVLGQLELSPQDRERLRQRGFNDEQIRAGMFRTAKQWQKLETPVSPWLAGIYITGRSLTNSQAGLLCPIWNPRGQIIGWQLRLDDADNGGKYRWATSASQKRPNGATAHLPNGELPLTYCRPLGKPSVEGIGLAEGILKPQIVAQLSGQIVLGASGGNFASSPETFKTYLAELEAEIDGQPLILYVDAGAIANKSVMHQYRKTHALLKKWRYEMRVAWWGQTTKNHLDIDEMLAAGRGDEIEAITWAEFEAIAHNPNQVWGEVTNLFRNLKQGLANSFKGFGKPPAEPAPAPKPTQSKPVAFDYEPGSLPTPEEHRGLGLPTIQYKDGQRMQVWQEATRDRGYQYVIDRSAPGLGKSFTSGTAQPEAFDVDKLFYFAANHRNPTTNAIEANYVDLPVRNAGMKRDFSRKTPLGQSFIIWPKKGEQPDLTGNCHRQPIFALLREKNISGIEGSESPICETCHLEKACRGNSGDGFGFRNQRRNAFESTRLRAHPNSAPQTHDFDYSVIGAIWDEAGQMINAMSSVIARLKDLDQIMGVLESKLPKIYDTLKPLRLVLRSLLSNEIKPAHARYGFDDATLRKLFPDVPDNLPEIMEELSAALKPDLEILNSTKEYGVDMKDLPNKVKRRFRQKPIGLVEQMEKLIPLNWLVPFLKVWSGERGALQYNNKELTISIPDYKHANLAEALKFNIFLDATISREYLAQLLNIDPSKILVIEQEVPNHQNLKIVHVTGLGQLGKKRSESLQNRVAPLKAELNSRHPDINYIDWTAQALEGEGRWFVDSRGSNQFKERQVLASFGVPYQNLGHLQALYQTLTGNCVSLLDKQNPDPQFQAFVNEHTQREITQAIGRLRSHIRPNEQLTYYFCGDYDLSFLGVPVEKVEAFEIAPEAGTDTQQAHWVIREAFKQISEAGGKLTQTAIASVAGFSQGRISQIAGEFGGWKSLKKILAFLLSHSNSTTNNFEPLTEEELWLAKSYLPLTLEDLPNDPVRQAVEVAKAVGQETFDAILRASPLKYQAQLISLAVQLLPVGVRGEIQRLAMEAPII